MMKKFIYILSLVLVAFWLSQKESTESIGLTILAFANFAIIYFAIIKPLISLRNWTKYGKRKKQTSNHISQPGDINPQSTNQVEKYTTEQVTTTPPKNAFSNRNVTQMTKISLPGQTKIETLQERFKEGFNLTLRVYDGRKYADPSATIAQVRKLTGPSEIKIAKHMKVKNVEKRFKDQFGIKVKIASIDDSYLCDGTATLKAAREGDERQQRVNRPVYELDFKREVAAAATVKGITLADVSEQYNVSVGSVRNWLAEYGKSTPETIEPNRFFSVLSKSSVEAQIDSDGDLCAFLSVPEDEHLHDHSVFALGSIEIKSGAKTEETTLEDIVKFDGSTSVRSPYLHGPHIDKVPFSISVTARLYSISAIETFEIEVKTGSFSVVPKLLKHSTAEAMRLSFDDDGDVVLEGKISVTSEMVIAYSFDLEAPSDVNALWPSMVENENEIYSPIMGAREGHKAYLTVVEYTEIPGEFTYETSSFIQTDSCFPEISDSSSTISDMDLSVSNIVYFGIDEFSYVNDETDYLELSTDDKSHYIKNAAYEVSGTFGQYIGEDELEIKFLVLNKDGTPLKLIELSDVDDGEFGPESLLDEDNCAYLFLKHAETDWNYACLKASEGVNAAFWAIGKNDDGDIVRQEYEDGDFSEGYFADEEDCINEERFIDLVNAVELKRSQL